MTPTPEPRPAVSINITLTPEEERKLTELYTVGGGDIGIRDDIGHLERQEDLSYIAVSHGRKHRRVIGFEHCNSEALRGA